MGLQAEVIGKEGTVGYREIDGKQRFLHIRFEGFPVPARKKRRN